MTAVPFEPQDGEAAEPIDVDLSISEALGDWFAAAEERLAWTNAAIEPSDSEPADEEAVREDERRQRAQRAAEIRRGLGHHSEADAIERRLAERDPRHSRTITGTSAERAEVYAALNECWPHLGPDELAAGADRVIDALLGRRA